MKPLLRRYCVLLALLIYWAPQAPAQVAPNACSKSRCAMSVRPPPAMS